MRALSALFCAACLGGCTLDIRLPEGRIACTEASECPSGWSCVATQPDEAGLCYRSAEGATFDASDDAETQAGLDASEAASDAAVQGRDANDTGRASDAGMDADLVSDTDTGTPEAGNDPDASAEASTQEEAGQDANASADASSPSDAASDANSQPDVVVTPNRAPTITVVRTATTRISTSDKANASCLASDPDSDALSFQWTVGSGGFENASANLTKYTPAKVGEVSLRCQVSDGRGGSVQGDTKLRVYPAGWLALLPFSLNSADESGNGHGGTVNGGVAAADRGGALNAAIELTAANQDITLAGESAFDLDAFSFVVTLKPTSLASGGTIVSKGELAFGNFTISFYGESDSVLPRRLQYAHNTIGDGPYAVILGNYQVTKNNFIQLVVTLSAARELRAYVDGTLIHSASNMPAAQHNDAPVVLGRSPVGGFIGVLDEVQFYNRALTQEEVTALKTMQ